ncbi:MAG: L,D-transpeptidase [Hyphomicrobiaceae bacterium]
MTRKLFLILVPMLFVAIEPALAQGWRWNDGGYRERGSYYPGSYRSYRVPPGTYGDRYERRRGYDDDEDEDEDDYYSRRRSYFDGDQGAPKVLSGGAQPSIAPISPQRVGFQSRYEPGTIVIDTAGRQLLLVQDGGSALRYPISVGRVGFSWTGEEKISRIAAWPDWHPPAEMRERDPKLPEKMTGGIRNPLGAKALYLGNTLYRIHGTNDAKSIGRAQSSGCFRMLNGHVLDLAERVKVGAKVVVVSSLRTVNASISR